MNGIYQVFKKINNYLTPCVHGGVLSLALPLACGGALSLGHGLALVLVDSLTFLIVDSIALPVIHDPALLLLHIFADIIVLRRALLVGHVLALSVSDHGALLVRHLLALVFIDSLRLGLLDILALHLWDGVALLLVLDVTISPRDVVNLIVTFWNIVSATLLLVLYGDHGLLIGVAHVVLNASISLQVSIISHTLTPPLLATMEK